MRGLAAILVFLATNATSIKALIVGETYATRTRRGHFEDVLLGGLTTAVLTTSPLPAHADGAKVCVTISMLSALITYIDDRCSPLRDIEWLSCKDVAENWSSISRCYVEQ